MVINDPAIVTENLFPTPPYLFFLNLLPYKKGLKGESWLN